MIEKRVFSYQFLKCKFSNYIVSRKTIKKFPIYKRFQCKVSIVPEQGWFGQPKYRFLKKTTATKGKHSTLYGLLVCIPLVFAGKTPFLHMHAFNRHEDTTVRFLRKAAAKVLP